MKVGRSPAHAHPALPCPTVRAILFDYGGVVAEEGFTAGLMAVGRACGLDAEQFFRLGEHLVYATGYVTGRATEHTFWQAVRRASGITLDDRRLTGEVLARFTPRPAMLGLAARLRRAGRLVAILSDQSDWLDRLEQQHGFSRHFHQVFNSYHLGRSKRDPAVFPLVARALGVAPAHCLLVDDNPGHVSRARQTGMAAHRYTGLAPLLAELARFGLAGH